MQIIPVMPDLSIELEHDKWRLVQDQDNGKTLQTLVEASPQVLRFHSTFVERHHLPAGELAASQVEKVVLGWTPESQNWQLGLFLKHSFANGSDVRWCELASFPSGAAHQYESAARSVGEALSRILNSPFQVVDGGGLEAPETDMATQPSHQTIPLAVRPVPLQDLPIELGDWIVRYAPAGMIWQLTSRWQSRHIMRVVFFVVVSVLFVLLGVGSLRSGLAPVNPDWLPYVSFGIALVVAYSALENLWKLLMRRQVVVDDLAREVRCEVAATGIVDWRVPYDRVSFLLVSQEPARPLGRRSRSDPMHITQNAWLHLYAGDRFYLVSEVENAQGKSWQWEKVRRRVPSEERLPLELTEYDTPLHHAALQMAKKLGVEAFVDVR